MLKLHKSLEIWAVSINDHNNGIWYAWCRYPVEWFNLCISEPWFWKISLLSENSKVLVTHVSFFLLFLMNCNSYKQFCLNIHCLQSKKSSEGWVLISCGFWVADGNRNFSTGGSTLESHMIRNCALWIQWYHMMCNSMHTISDHNISWLTVHLSVW